MKTLLTLAAAILFVANATSAFADSPEVKSQGQPFEHPEDSASYSKDVSEDEALAKSTPSDNGHVRYVSGGIGESGMRAIDKEESTYNLKMLFVGKNGEYLSDVNVKISDAKGNIVLDTATKGPVLLVHMKRGHYTVDAKGASGFDVTNHVEVGNDHLCSYVFRFPAKEQ